jgi:thiol:disulfide interchange protein DsbG
MRALLACCAALVLALAGCKDGGGSAGPGKATSAAKAPSSVSIEQIESRAKGFDVGSAISARTVYVFFDSQCPHCAALWESARPLKAQARFVWIPVGVLNGKSVTQGAAILAAPDPVAAMDAHELSMREGRGGIVPAGDVGDRKAAVEGNTKLLDGFGIGSIPTIVAKNAQTGALVVQEGALPTAALANLLGLNLPNP